MAVFFCYDGSLFTWNIQTSSSTSDKLHRKKVHFLYPIDS